MCYQYCYWRCIKVALYIFLSFEVLSLIFCLCFKVFLVLRRLVFESSINVQIISERESRYWKAEGSIETWRIYCHSYSAINTRANTVPWSVVPRTGGTLQEDDWKNSCCLEEKRSAVKHEKLCKCLNISSLWNTESRQDSRGSSILHGNSIENVPSNVASILPLFPLVNINKVFFQGILINCWWDLSFVCVLLQNVSRKCTKMHAANTGLLILSCVDQRV